VQRVCDPVAYGKRMVSVKQTPGYYGIVKSIFSSFYQEPECGQLWLLAIMVSATGETGLARCAKVAAQKVPVNSG
jgi:hypothetical protein